MNIIDIIILLAIAMGAVVGFKQGGIHRLTTFIGTILVFSISWIFKDEVAGFIYDYVPFIRFSGTLEGLDTLNILFYELVAFASIFAILTVVFRMILVITGLIEKILKLTIFLSIPSKMLGIFVGAIEAYFYVFIALIVLNLPFINFTMVKESGVANFILNDTIILSGVSEKLVNTYDSVYDIIENRKEDSNAETNEKIMVILLDNKIISVENLERLIIKNKVVINDQTILDNYR